MNNEELRKANIFELAKFLHTKYQEIAFKNGWNQENRKCSFKLLPVNNQLTMLKLAEWLIDYIDEDDLSEMLRGK